MKSKLRLSMMLSFGFLLAIGTSIAADASIRVIADPIITAVRDSVTDVTSLQVDVPSRELGSADNLALVQVSFHARVESGDELELWLMEEARVLPWQSEVSTHRVDLWTVDETTGTLVRFDLTRYFKRSLRAGEDPPRFVIRRVTGETEETLTLSENSRLRVDLHTTGR